MKNVLKVEHSADLRVFFTTVHITTINNGSFCNGAHRLFNILNTEVWKRDKRKRILNLE